MIGQSVPRLESMDKVTGRAMYSDDVRMPGLLHAYMVTSPEAHARIVSIDTREALAVPGVLAVVTGESCTFSTGRLIEDRPPLAREKVRYYGEPVAVVVAYTENQAMQGAFAVRVHYESLPVVNTLDAALAKGAPLVHENMNQYNRVKPTIYPEQGTNIAHRLKMRKGDMAKGWAASEVIIEGTYSLPQKDHVAMETRSARVEILPNGQVIIHTSTQAPHSIKEDIFRHFHVPMQSIVVVTPLVGGAFGGKATVQLEYLAFLASQAVGGRAVKLANTREQDIATSPVGVGVEGTMKLGATRDGRLQAMEATYRVNSGAYTDSTPIICEAITANGTGPYRVDNVYFDTLCIYTNRPYGTAFRGFGHTAYTFVVERTLDKLAYALGMDPLELRRRNALVAGDTSPTRVRLTPSNIGNLPACIDRVRELIDWEEGSRVELRSRKVRAKGLSCFWKTSSSPPNAHSAAIITMNDDGSFNLNCGVVELGQGTKTALAQILAERLQVDVNQIHVAMTVDTQFSPEHWKTVASMGTYMAGRAVLEAADDVIRQLRDLAAIVLRCSPHDLGVGGGKVYLKSDPSIFLDFMALAHGYEYTNGNSIGGQVIGRGTFIMRHLTSMDPETGQGKTGPGWSVGAQAVEVEFDPNDFHYRILRAVTVLDVGRVLNPKNVHCVVSGAMSMGLSYASREVLAFGATGRLDNPQLRTYKLVRYGEHPQFIVDYIETPMVDAPYGARGLAEHGILGMPGALANALSVAAQVELDDLPLIPETIWRAKGGGVS